VILLIDNYDSFSYNLYQLIGSMAPDIRVVRNDEFSVEELAALFPARLVISPGPGRPADAGVCVEAVRYFAGRVPLLGVCLGHQAVCEAFGATVSYAKTLTHGKASSVTVDTGTALFAGLPPVIQAGRYHSLAAMEDSVPPVLVVTARTEDGEIMAVRHRDHSVYGVQFHPESILTPLGGRILENFINND
jgi:anthranilate synthase component 2